MRNRIRLAARLGISRFLQNLSAVFFPGSGRSELAGAAVVAEIAAQDAFHRADREWTRKFRERLLSRMVGRAMRVPVYQTLWGGSGTVRDFDRLPVITKKEFRASWPDGVTVPGTSKARMREVRSTGSTGIPFRAFSDTKSWPILVATYFQAYLEAGSDLREQKIFFVAPWTGESIWPWLEPGNVSTFDFTALYPDPANAEASLEKFMHADVVEGPASHLVEVARLLEDRGMRPKINTIMYAWEQMLEAERRRLEEFFHGTVSSYYGMNELGFIGFECKAHVGFHINEKGYVVEILDDEGKPLPSRERGRVVITSLSNEVMPFVRYDTGDRGALLTEPCACGRTSSRLLLEGRRDDFLLLPGGRKVHAFLVYEVFYPYWQTLWRYQLVQRSETDIEVRIMPAKGFSEEVETRIVNGLRQLLGSDVRLRVSLVPKLPSPDGKRKIIVRTY